MNITLATLAEATEQEVFTQVKNHLISQGGKSIVKDYPHQNSLTCMYRGSEGRKCAAGALIADDEYKPEMERKSWEAMIRDFNYSRNCVFLIAELQAIHDNIEPCLWEVELKKLAESLKLKYNA